MAAGASSRSLADSETKTTAGVLVSRLEAYGITCAFGIPGTHLLPLYRELGRSSIRHVTPRHEQGGGYAADAYARVTGRPAACFVTTGPGLLNIAAAAAQAHHDSVPMVIVAPGMPTDIDGRDTGYLHEVKDQHGAMNALVADAHRVQGPADAAAAVDRLMAGLGARRPRPAYFEVPLNLMETRGRVPTELPERTSAPAPDLGAIDSVAALIKSADSCALVVGGGAVNCGDLVLELARRIAAPVITTANGKGTIPERDPLSLGAALRLQSCQQFLRSRAVVVAIGTEFAESDLWRKPPLDLSGSVVRIDIDPDQIDKNQAADIGIVTDARIALAALLERIPRDGPPRLDDSVTQIRELFVKEALADGEQFIGLMTQLRSALPDEAIIVGDSAMACYFGAVHFLQVDAPRRYLHPTGFATLGYALPGAIGAKVASPDTPVVALSGDGGFQFTLQELATAVDLRLSLPIIIVDNHGYGEIRREMVENGITPLGVDLAPVDFVALAQAYGARGTTIDDPSSLPALLKDALEARVPTVIMVSV